MAYTFYGTASITNSLRSNIAAQTQIPGPGTYNPIIKNSLPKWSLKQRNNHGSCFNNHSIAPPPGTYETIESFKKAKSQEKSKDFIIAKYKSFGQKSSPMSLLNIPSSISTKLGFAFGVRQQVIVKQTSPGPIYDVSRNYSEQRILKKKNTCRGFGFGDRNGIYKKLQQTPGPGAYHSQVQNRQTSTWTFSKQKKNNLRQQSTNQPIGPGQYSPKMPQSSKACVLKGKYPQPKKQIFNTGPGSYNPPQPKSTIGGRFNTNKKQKPQDEQDNNKQTPSPFHYNPKRYPQTMSHSAGFSLAGSLKNKQNNANSQNPGPGSYAVTKDSIKKLQGGYMGKKLSSKKKQTLDNFYKYSPNFEAVSRQSPKYSFANSYGSDRQNEDKVDDGLGPGSYKITLKKGQMYSIGKEDRWKQSEVPPFYNHTNIQELSQTIGYMPKYLKKGSKFVSNGKQNQIKMTNA